MNRTWIKAAVDLQEGKRLHPALSFEMRTPAGTGPTDPVHFIVSGVGLISATEKTDMKALKKLDVPALLERLVLEMRPVCEVCRGVSATLDGKKPIVHIQGCPKRGPASNTSSA